MTFTFRKSFMSDFQDKLNEVNRKLERFEQKVEILDKEEFTQKEEFSYGNVSISYIKVQVSEPQIVGRENVRFIGTISFKQGIKQIFSNTEGYILGEIPEDSLTCEHCHIDRYRVKYHFYEEDGNLKSIGSTCANEYFGFDIEKMLTVYEREMTGLGDDVGGFGSGFYGYPLLSVIIATKYITRNFKSFWVSKAKAEETMEVSTGDQVSNLLNTQSQYLPDDYKQMQISDSEIESIRQDLIDYRDKPLESDFDHNIHNNLFDSENNLRDYIVSIGVVAYAAWKLYHKDEPKEYDFSQSQYLGQVKDKLELDVEVLNVFEMESQYGFVKLTLMREGNNSLKWWNSGSLNLEKGQRVRIKGTVKAHESYLPRNGNGSNGPINTTVLTRVKVI